jgi:anti-anti-sigma factor
LCETIDFSVDKYVEDQPRAADPVVVDVPGPVEHEAGDYSALQDVIRRLLADGHTRILLNVESVVYGDSVLLGAIMQAYASAARQGASLKLQHVRKRFADLLSVTKLDRVLQVEDTN